MTTPRNNNASTMGEMYRTIAMNVLLPVVFVALTAMVNWMNKLEDRQYALQREAVTEQKLGATEGRIMNYIDVRLKDVDNKMNLIIRQLEIMNARNRPE